MRGEVRTGCVAPGGLWNEEPRNLDVLRRCVDHLLVSRVVVIALQEPLVVRTGSNDRHALHGRSERQHPVVGQQDGRLCDGLTS